MVVNVGKRCGVKTITQDEINALMIEHARAGRSVVRLKSGDPLLFGRAAEEMTALDDAGVAYRNCARGLGGICRGSGAGLLAHRPQLGLECDLLHRPSCAIAQSRAAAGA